MAHRLRARGRPKGSGVNDHARLEAVARLIETYPEMKPTTAIKKTGVSDPSTIRRLREKLKVHSTDLPRSSPASHDNGSARPLSATAVPSVARPQEPSSRTGAAAAALAVLEAPSHLSQAAGLWLGLYSASVSAASVALGVQMFALSSAFAVSPFGQMSWDLHGEKNRHDRLELDTGAVFVGSYGQTVH
ncbi:MAG: hypothetical protein NW216_09115 [Hyphomicrobium sp.]|nr:hypothetical protein [Hyphomicrobium sp.]